MAYISLTERGRPGEVYNVCSGRSYAVADLIETLAGLAGVEARVEPHPSRVRRVDIPERGGSYAKLAGATGWAPSIEMSQTLADLLASLDES